MTVKQYKLKLLALVHEKIREIATSTKELIVFISALRVTEN